MRPQGLRPSGRGELDALDDRRGIRWAIPKFATPLLIPPVMPRAGTKKMKGGKNGDVYEISVRQFAQQILPATLPTTTVWGYGAVEGRGAIAPADPQRPFAHDRGAGRDGRSRSSGSTTWWTRTATTCRTCCRSTRRCTGRTRPAGPTGRDMRPTFEPTPGPYTGPVPMVTHVHGAVGVGDDSDGYAEAWYLPAATTSRPATPPRAPGTSSSTARRPRATARPGAQATRPSSIRTCNRASTIWYHDHTLGMTRLNVYAGPAGFYIIRGGPDGDKAALDGALRSGCRPAGTRPPRRATSSRPTRPTSRSRSRSRIARSTPTGRSFYPDTREFFDTIVGPFMPEGRLEGHAGFSPIWNPEFFGNATRSTIAIIGGAGLDRTRALRRAAPDEVEAIPTARRVARHGRRALPANARPSPSEVRAWRTRKLCTIGVAASQQLVHEPCRRRRRCPRRRSRHPARRGARAGAARCRRRPSRKVPFVPTKMSAPSGRRSASRAGRGAGSTGS